MSDPAAELRRECLARRDSLPAGEIQLRSRVILVKVETLPVVAAAALVHCYLPSGSEVDTIEFVSNLLQRGRRVAVAVRTAAGLESAEITTVDDLKATTHGRLEPAPGERSIVEPSALEAVIVPGLAFSRDGSRLGYGDGGYAALLARVSCPIVAPVFDFQLIAEVPASLGATRADYVVGETIAFNARQGSALFE